MDALRLKGLDDLVLLDKIDEENVVNLIKNRLVRDGEMYTFMGPVLIAVNPFKVLTNKATGQSIYHESIMDGYRGRVYYEMPPSVFSVAESAYSHMLRNNEPTSIIVSGESGAGKTETARQILAYIARITSLHTKEKAKSAAGVVHVKDRLVTSTLVTEAFGNAMTQRNDNSSRFGKLMTINFKGTGAAESGLVQIYLLEKHRIISQAPRERSFHAFYYLLAGASAQQKRDLKLANADAYNYLGNEARTIPGVSDAQQFKALVACMNILGFSETEQSEMWKILASVLHLGNLDFSSAESEGGDAVRSSVNAHAAHFASDSKTAQARDALADLLAIKAADIEGALIKRTMNVGATAGANSFTTLQNATQAKAARDSLAKALYEKLFDFAVAKINKSIAGDIQKDKEGEVPEDDTAKTMRMSILDLYGFEIFEKNGFEQLCINFVNESLQQLFIDATLKAEQEEYQREGITWTPIDFFDNQIVVELFERKPGVFSLLDDACTVADATAARLFDTFEGKLGKHAHFQMPKINDGRFTVRHYAGDVAYSVEGMIEANRDYLHNDLIKLMETSPLETLKKMFYDPRTEQEKQKRPPTTGTQFRQSVASLLAVLRESSPFYVRCIKSNDQKRPVTIDDERLVHQVRYLGLVEATRVKRAGYAYRADFSEFVQRYRMISSVTWPPSNEDPETLVKNFLQTVALWPKPANEALGVGQMADKKQAKGKPAAGAGAKGAPGPAFPKLTAKQLPGDVSIPGAQKLREGIDYQMGATKVFLKEPKTLFALEYMRIVALAREVSKIAALWRAYAGKRAYAKIKAAWLKQQANVRAKLARNRFLRMKKSAVHIQAVVRGHLTRNSAVVTNMRQALGMIKFYGKIRRRKSLQWKLPAHNDWLGVLDPALGMVAPAAGRLESAVSRLTPRQTLGSTSFADYVWKIKQNYNVYRRALIVTEHFVLNVNDPWMSGRINRAIPIQAISAISVSAHRDNYVVIHVPGQYDFACICESKIHLVTAIVNRYQELCAAPLPVQVGDAISYKAFKRDGPEKSRGIQFRLVEDASVFDSRAPAAWEAKLQAANHGCGGPPDTAVDDSAVVSTVARAHAAAERRKAFHAVQPDAKSIVVFVPVPPAVKLADMLTEQEKTKLRARGFIRA